MTIGVNVVNGGLYGFIWFRSSYNQNYGTKRARASVSMKKRVCEMYPHGAVWVNDGNKEFRCDSESIPIGCVRGRLR